ncbi:MAG TPA: CHRD domain-containing protein [Gaiellaceae bacterium]|nr:CHRD domain-containing protein [Gaiellaceae bacterium]
MRKIALVAVLVLIGAFGVTAMAFADHGDDGKRSFSARLDGWGETPSVVTTGHGSFRLRVVSPVLWEFVLRWEELEGGSATAAHIHVGSHHESGGVSAHLCGGTQPPCPPGPDGEVRGTIDPTDVTGPTGQGVEPGNMADLLRAMRVGETYPNIHNARFPAGEIRGQILDRHNHGGGGDGDSDD